MSDTNVPPPQEDEPLLLGEPLAPPRRRPRWQLLLAVFAVMGILGVTVVTGFIWSITRDLPDYQAVVDYQPALPTTVYGRDGEVLTIFARERRIFVPFEDIPQPVIHAFISAEDKTFFKHNGLDFPGIFRAMMTNVRNKLTGASKRPVGASTITQQVAQALLVGRELSYIRKIREMVLATRIEKAISKEQILELYLNQIFLGQNAYGLGAAAFAYYGERPDELTLEQIAYLAALPKGPSLYHPIREKALATERRNYVLGQMLANGYINQADHDAAVAAPLEVKLGGGGITNRTDDFVLEEIRRQLIARFGEEAVYTAGLRVHATIDPAMQAAALKAMQGGMLRLDRGKNWRGPVATVDLDADWPRQLRAPGVAVDYADWRAAAVLGRSEGDLRLGFANGSEGLLPRGEALRPRNGVPAADQLKAGDVIIVAPLASASDRYSLRQVPAVSGGFIAEDPSSGHILAMVGGFDAGRSQFNRATQAMRQPGSAFKPFVYATALDNGYSPASLVVDGQFCVYQGRTLGRKCFRNFDRRQSGAKTLRDGLEKSRNLMTVRLAHKVGMDKVAATAKALHIVDEMSPVLAMALGAGETSVERLVNAYAILVGGGRDLQPTLIDRVHDRDGKVIYRSDARVCTACNAEDWLGGGMPELEDQRPQVIDARTAFQVVHMLKGVVERGTATRLKNLPWEMAGKTGTTNNSTDVWYVGFTPELVAGLYLGHDQPTPMGSWVQGGTVAAPVWGEFASVALKGRESLSFPIPEGVRMVRMDRRSGKLVYREGGKDIIWEAFKPGNEPRQRLAQDDGQFLRSDADFVEAAGGIY